MKVAPGATDVTTYFKLVDPASGVPETGLTITDLDATYVRDRAAAVKADLTALAAADDAHADNKAIQVDATNAPGLYRVDWPDAAFAAGVSRVQLVVNGAAIDPAVIEVELETPQTGDAFARLGAPAGASVSADIAAIEAQTDDIGVAGAGLTAITGVTLAATESQVIRDALKLAPTAGAPAAGSVDAHLDDILTDTGTDIPAQIAALDCTVALSATQAASVATGALAIRTYHTLAQTLTSTSTADLSAATKLWFVIKSRRSDTDAQSVVFIEAAAGLTYLAGATYATAGHGTLTVGGIAGAWTITVGLDEVATGLLHDYAESMLWAECKALVAGSTVAVWDGVCDVSHGIVVAVA